MLELHRNHKISIFSITQRYNISRRTFILWKFLYDINIYKNLKNITPQDIYEKIDALNEELHKYGQCISDKSFSNKKPPLTPGQMEDLSMLLKESAPRNFCPNAVQWARSIISEVIKQNFNITCTCKEVIYILMLLDTSIYTLNATLCKNLFPEYEKVKDKVSIFSFCKENKIHYVNFKKNWRQHENTHSI